MTDALIAEMEASWPPETAVDGDGWRLRVAPGGGSRVNSARRLGAAVDGADALAAVERFYAARDADALIQAREDDGALSEAASAAGYAAFDHSGLYEGSISDACAAPSTPPDGVRLIRVEHVPAALEQFWASLGVGAPRLAVMARAAGPKTAVAARVGDRLAGAVFVSAPSGRAFVHALAVAPTARRRGIAALMTRAALTIVAERGAARFATSVVRGNVASEGLFQTLGARPSGGYIYLRKSLKP